MRENQHAERIPLDGVWKIEIDNQSGNITVPGVWEVQGYPRDITTAQLQREFDVPASWHDKQVILSVGAASYDVTFEINGKHVGQHIGMWSPFEFDVSPYLCFDARNTITVTIVKPSNTSEGDYPYREVLVGFVPYVSSTFGGIWQSIELCAYSNLAWKDVFIQSHVSEKSLYIRAELDQAKTAIPISVIVRDADGNTIVKQDTHDTQLDMTLRFENIQCWQPDNPYLYTVELRANGVVTTRQFGFRELSAQGQDLLLNGQHCMLRGILSWGWNPETLAPRFTDDFIREEFQRVRELGFNLYKLCLYIPPENVLRIADEMGMLIWLEMPMWWQLDNPHLREQMPKEYAEILARLHHHPSIILVSLGCEIEGHMISEGLVRQLESLVREQIDGILLCENSGSGEAYHGLTSDIADFYDYHFYADAHFFQPMVEHFRRDWRTPRPWIFGEFAAQDDYRNPETLVDAQNDRLWWRDLLGTDGGIHRWAYRHQEERVAALNLPFNHDELQILSRKQSYALRKLILETTRRNNGMGGYVITGLRDTPISTSGLWDDHLKPKYTVEEMHQINNDDVLLLEQGRQRIWLEGDRPYPQDKFNYWSGATADFYILFSGINAPGTTLRWRVTTEDGQLSFSDEQTILPPKLDANPHQIARITYSFPHILNPTRCTLHVACGEVTNQWDFWVYPKDIQIIKETASRYDPSGVLHALADLPLANLADTQSMIIASALTQELQVALESGAHVVLIQSGRGTLPAKRIGYWQESLNLLLDHALWDDILCDEVATEQFYHVAGSFAFDPTQMDYVPVMRRLHTRLFTATDMIIDKRIGKGRLLATTLNLLGGAGDQAFGLEKNVFGTFLLAKMLKVLMQ